MWSNYFCSTSQRNSQPDQNSENAKQKHLREREVLTVAERSGEASGIDFERKRKEKESDDSKKRKNKNIKRKESKLKKRKMSKCAKKRKKFEPQISNMLRLMLKEKEENSSREKVLEAVERKSTKKGEKTWKLEKLNPVSISRPRVFKFGVAKLAKMGNLGLISERVRVVPIRYGDWFSMIYRCTIYNWSLDIWNYLKHDNLPKDKMEARKTRSKASRYTIFEDQLYRRSTSRLLLRCVVSQA
ncbi:hypothetical protein OSB04_024085 [Centaurea solstitialis]|uniref:Uncharacterized protein n=1 Tax=Centaurea solstitialis TaxID=347529 RepID=A0AA38SL31_9ASTR|nr:hypothetical protein OSB04_024085 [Centaurea solstitialis]